MMMVHSKKKLLEIIVLQGRTISPSRQIFIIKIKTLKSFTNIKLSCIFRRGRYGYIDPDGNKREYSYETGNQCDPNKRDQSDEGQFDEAGAYVDYQENAMILPNGDRISLNSIGKNKSKRPAYNN